MIAEFQGKYRWLSNFWDSPIIVYGFDYATVEHYYQSRKADNSKEWDEIRHALTPGNAKYRGLRCSLRKDWDGIKDIVMYEGVLAKFSQNPDLSFKLLLTGEEEIVEGNTWGDRYWGICLGEGQNKLGKILMSVRSHLEFHEPFDEFGK